MEICFTDNIEHTLLDILNKELSNSLHTKISVAFAKLSGYNLLKDLLNDNLQSGKSVEIVLGLDYKITDPQILRELFSLSGRNLPIDYCCFSEAKISDLPFFHPKLYMLNKEDAIISAIGSSNLTKGGLKSNIEVNTIIYSNPLEEVTSDLIDVFNRIKYRGLRFIPDEAYIDAYERVYETAKKEQRKKVRSVGITNEIKKLKEQEMELPKPTLKPENLSGWMKAVWERLPEKEFSNQDIYRYKKEFSQIYPENRNIEAKIRQQLQFLRDIELLDHAGRNLWKKIR